MQDRRFQRALEAGACFSLIGLFCGLALFNYFSQYLEITPSPASIFSPAIAAFLIGALLWWMTSLRTKRVWIGGGIIIGILVGLFSIPISFYLAGLYDFLFHRDSSPARAQSADTLNAADLLHSFWNLHSVGWVGMILCGAVGGLLAYRQRRTQQEYKESATQVAIKKPEKDIVSTNEMPQEPTPAPAVVPMSLICPFCKGPLSEGKVVRCSVCDTKHHAACWEEHGRCSVFNCPGKEEVISISKRKVHAVVSIAAAIACLAVAGLWFFLTVREEPSETKPAVTVQKAPPPGMYGTVGPAECDQSDLNPQQKQEVKELLEAARYGQNNRILALIRSGAASNAKGLVSVFKTDHHCWTPLITAAYYGNTETVQMLIDAGIPTDGSDDYGYTALLMAVIGNHLDTVKALLKAGANVNAENRDGDGALLLAAIRGNADMVRSLIRARVNINASNFLGYPALIQALRAKQFEIAGILLQANADPNLSDLGGRTALSWACELGNAEMVTALLKADAHVNVKDRLGATPLMYATMVGNREIVLTLIQAGADINARDAQGQTALVYAQKTYRTDLTKLLDKVPRKK